MEQAGIPEDKLPLMEEKKEIIVADPGMRETFEEKMLLVLRGMQQNCPLKTIVDPSSIKATIDTEKKLLLVARSNDVTIFDLVNKDVSIMVTFPEYCLYFNYFKCSIRTNS